MGKKRKDLTGRRCGRLIILKSKRERNHIFCYCTCDCDSGTNKRLVHKIKEYQIKEMGRKSCGCLRGDKPSEYGSTYLGEMPNYITLQKKWDSYWNKCYNSKQNCDYSKKGIIMCSEWADKKDGALLFYAWAIKRDFEDGDRIKRIDKSLGYFPENCMVVKKQSNNALMKKQFIAKGKNITDRIDKTHRYDQINVFHNSKVNIQYLTAR
ncbi:hypothetical protein [Desulfosporosinus hippei]|uniref:AP2 domain-containing protein n=1 Tax=Desulfosporosinus hippei DSM 8344 TaxID=1121419 RepID=A0A1G7Z5K2_9FIRM|nr:hypothetical protein [Desulfosporosinus hippei]SDH03964.1 hypothetical protein SAMN05443529_10914 [Desulfosporosinus hippei DSM 8344]